MVVTNDDDGHSRGGDGNHHTTTTTTASNGDRDVAPRDLLEVGATMIVRSFACLFA